MIKAAATSRSRRSLSEAAASRSRLATIGTVAAVVLAAGCGKAPPAPAAAPVGSGNTGIRFLAGGDADGYARATAPRRFVFPRDHGGHPEFRTEWWYFTGNLFGENGRRYGFELTFFRVALAPGEPDRPSEWATHRYWMAHFAVTDTDGGRFIAAEKLSRGALGLAGSQASPFKVWVEDWSAEGPIGADAGMLRLRARSDDAEIDLALEMLTPPVPNGDGGLDPKGPEPGNASYYYSVPRWSAEGSIGIDGKGDAVSGLAWMDREWSTSALSAGIAGWDWFALQLSDGRDLMVYRLRADDGTTSPFSSGTLIGADGTATHLGPADFALAPQSTWTSPDTGVTYPVAWRVALPAQSLTLDVAPALEDQELDLSVRYWEGAVDVGGRGPGGAVSGHGYLELAGY